MTRPNLNQQAPIEGEALLKMKFQDWLSSLWLSGRRDSMPREAEEDSEADPFNPFPEPVSIKISDVFDLHSVPPREVQRLVEEYLYQVRLAGFSSVRIIHGKGIGVQRGIVRKILARTSFITNWNDAPPEAGGLGATIAYLKRTVG